VNQTCPLPQILYTQVEMSGFSLALSKSLCACGRDLVQKAGLCLPCYNRNWQDKQHFGGKRERVIDRDGHACRVCGGVGDLIVHHRIPSEEDDALITLCRPCHVWVHHIIFMDRHTNPLLLTLWKEQHPGGLVQPWLLEPEAVEADG
jgi:hypothetical protein